MCSGEFLRIEKKKNLDDKICFISIIVIILITFKIDTQF